MAANFLTEIEQRIPSLSKGQRTIARYILEHYERAAFMTAAKLGVTVGVSESTVVRFASEVGCDGYPAFQHKLQKIIRNRLTSVQRIEITNEQIGRADVVNKVLQMDIDRIKHTMEEIDHQGFNEAVTQIIQARKIYILGIRSAASLANFLSFYFNHIFDNVRLVNTNSTSEMFEQIFRMNQDDVLIAISFPRYSQRTIKAANYARNRGAHVISITDSLSSPLAASSDTCLCARSDMASFVDSLVAPLSLINALVVAVGLEKQGEISQTFSELERIWDEYNVYEKAKDDEKNDAF